MLTRVNFHLDFFAVCKKHLTLVLNICFDSVKDGYRNADDANFTAKWMLIATWHKVKAYGMSDNKVRYAEPLTTTIERYETSFRIFWRYCDSNSKSLSFLVDTD